LVHGIIDFDGIVDPRHIAASVSADFWLHSDEAISDTSKLLPPFDADRWQECEECDASRVVASPSDVEQALLAIAAQRDGAHLAQIPGLGESALPIIRSLLDVLPAAVTGRLGFSTYEARNRVGALDLVAVGDEFAPRPRLAWASLVVSSFASDPQGFARLRVDPSLASLSDLVAAVEVTYGPLDADRLRVGLLTESTRGALIKRNDFSRVLIAALDEDPEWWANRGRESLASLPLGAVFGQRESILELALQRLRAGRFDSADLLIDMYRRVTPLVGDRLADVESMVEANEDETRRRVVRRLLRNASGTDLASLEHRSPLLRFPWSELADVVVDLPDGLVRAVVAESIIHGAPDGAPRLTARPARCAIEIASELSRRLESRARLAHFLVQMAGSAPDPDQVLVGALTAGLPGEFVRSELAEEILHAGYLPSSELQQHLMRAGLVDYESYASLVAPRASRPPEADVERPLRGRLRRR
jgi:hypothetical protein